MKFTEAQLESAIIDLLKDEGYPYLSGESIQRSPQEVLIKEDLREYLSSRYEAEGITGGEIDSIIRQLEATCGFSHNLFNIVNQLEITCQTLVSQPHTNEGTNA